MKPVLALGDANSDLIIRLPRSKGDPVPPPELHGGGTIANTAVGIRRLGVPVRFAGAVGNDGYGRFVARDLAAEGVDVTLLRETDRDFTVSVFAVIGADGDRTITVWPPEGGAHAFFAPEDLPPGAVRAGGWLHCSGIALRRSPVRETIIHAATHAAEAGIPVSLDLNLRLEFWGWKHEIRDTLHRLLPFVDIVFGSLEDEILPLVNGREEVDAEAQGATRRVEEAGAEGRRAMAALADGRRSVVARRGAEGALLMSPTGALQSRPARPARVVDSVGAGDAFNAGFIAARMSGRDEARALDWGLCASAHQIAREGARALPSREELERCLAGE
jgi:sugar/nucleoside kinase (ribokinase family)